MRAFASGATSMTGIEAVSNAVPVFRPVQWRNARTVLTSMVAILIVLFVALLVLIHLEGLVPNNSQTLLSQLAAEVLGRGAMYGFIQGATALELVFAADTAFNGLPRVLFFMARNDHAPRAFLRMGDRLAFSNGIILLAVASMLVLVAFHGRTESLIPLFAVGVFLAFTLSQAGMVTHWWRIRSAHWRKSMAINTLGAVASGLVLVTAAVTKFLGGAWVVVAAVPLLTLLLLRIKAHYASVEEQTSVADGWRDDLELVPTLPSEGPVGDHRALRPDAAATPEGVRHFLVVPLAHIDLPSMQALAYAVSFGQPTLVLHVSPEEVEAERFQTAWDRWGAHVPLEVVVSPFRAVVGPIVNYLEVLHSQRPDLTLTVIVPELKVKRWWHGLLHDHLGERLRHALEHHDGIAVTDVPFHLLR